MPYITDPDTGEERWYEEGHPDIKRIEQLEELERPKQKIPWALLAVALGAVLFLNRRKHI